MRGNAPIKQTAQRLFDQERSAALTRSRRLWRIELQFDASVICFFQRDAAAFTLNAWRGTPQNETQPLSRRAPVHNTLSRENPILRPGPEESDAGLRRISPFH